MEAILCKIKTIWNFIDFLFVNTSNYKLMLLFLAFVVFFTTLNLLIILPLIFNFFVIPRIEKKTGKRLQFKAPQYSYFPYGICLVNYIEIADYIVENYLGKKKFPEYYALVVVDYDVKCASRFEIIMSFTAIIMLILFIVSGIASFFVFSK